MGTEKNLDKCAEWCDIPLSIYKYTHTIKRFSCFHELFKKRPEPNVMCSEQKIIIGSFIYLREVVSNKALFELRAVYKYTVYTTRRGFVFSFMNLLMHASDIDNDSMYNVHRAEALYSIGWCSESSKKKTKARLVFIHVRMILFYIM